MDTIAKFQQKLNNKVLQNKDISHFLTLKTQTRAEYYFMAESREDIVAAIQAADGANIPFFFLGGGSNLAIVHDQIEGLVIHNKYIKKEIVDNTKDYSDVLFSSGYPMSRLVKETTKAGLEGFEYHLGLPGTIGGAIYMNSKWTKPVHYCGDSLLHAHLIGNDGVVRKVDREYFQFAYDFSILQKTKEIFLDGVFRLQKADPDILKHHSQEALAYRKETQPFGVATGGCFFQNISLAAKEKHGLPTTSAGYLIDHAGLKGKQIGGFIVSDKHANFIVNTGNGQPKDLHALLDFIKQTVKDKYGVDLKEEVIIV